MNDWVSVSVPSSTELVNIDVQMIDHPLVESLAGMSDQQSYWEFDIPALMINDTAFIRKPNYQLMTDDIDTLKFDSMQDVVASTYNTVVGYLSDEYTGFG